MIKSIQEILKRELPDYNFRIFETDVYDEEFYKLVNGKNNTKWRSLSDGTRTICGRYIEKQGGYLNVEKFSF